MDCMLCSTSRFFLFSFLTKQEIDIQGLSGHKPEKSEGGASRLPQGERGNNDGKKSAKGDFVCEYNTYEVYPLNSPLHLKLRDKYDKNGEGSFTIITAHLIPNGLFFCKRSRGLQWSPCEIFNRARN